jgi:dihydroxyacetone kinase-like protein
MINFVFVSPNFPARYFKWVESLAARGIRVHRTMVGNYMTSLDMAGFSITLLKLDDELKALLDAPCDTPALVQA